MFNGETSPNWSFVRVKDGLITEVVDKKPVTDIALIGWYFWKSGKDMIDSFNWLVKNDIRTNNEFMQNIPYNNLIENGGKIKPVFLDRSKIHGLGTPIELEEYLKK